MRTEPLAPSSVVERVEIGTTDTQIAVRYEKPTDYHEIGGSPLISLELWYDQGVDNWVSRHGAYPSYTLDETFIIKRLIPGHSYNFKYRAVNIFGAGAFSQVTTIKAATKPDQIIDVTQSVVNADLHVSWSSPNSRGDPIVAFNLYVIDGEGEYQE